MVFFSMHFSANQTGKERIDIVLQSDYTPYYKEAAAQGRPLLPKYI